MERINKIIEGFFKNLPPEKAKEVRVFQIFNHLIPEKYREATSLKEVKNGVIFVKVSSPVFRNDIEFMKNEFIKKINQEIGETFITDIKIQGV